MFLGLWCVSVRDGGAYIFADFPSMWIACILNNNLLILPPSDDGVYHSGKNFIFGIA